MSSNDASEDCKATFASGCGHILLAPPCLNKVVDDEGLYRWFSEVIESAGPNPRHFVLYHIPAITQVGLSVELVTRLAAKFPDVVVAVKDSPGNWPHTQPLIEERGMRIGAPVAIAGTSNVISEIIKAIVHNNSEQPNLTVLIDELLKYPVIPAVKRLIAHRTGSSAWLRLRSPFTMLDGQSVNVLGKHLDKCLRCNNDIFKAFTSHRANDNYICDTSTILSLTRSQPEW